VNALPAIAAGITFSGTVLICMFAGIVISQRTGQALWVIGGLVVGIALGGYGAFRLVARSMQ
jgi:putative F0F1-ATPase subunit (Ca2+/Mg2+ transporter)